MVSTVKGDRETARALMGLSRGIPIAMVDRAARSSMKPMLDTAKKGARSARNYVGKYPGFPQPKPRVHLDQGLIVGAEGAQTKTKRKFLLGAKGRARRIAHLVEFGTRFHWQPKFRGGWMHPGAKRRTPFMTRAYQAHGDQVPSAMGRELWQAIRLMVISLGGRR